MVGTYRGVLANGRKVPRIQWNGIDASLPQCLVDSSSHTNPAMQSLQPSDKQIDCDARVAEPAHLPDHTTARLQQPLHALNHTARIGLAPVERG
jgi:hypothetical protein